MNIDHCSQKLDTLRLRLTTLWQYVSELSLPQSELLLSAFEELCAMSEELQVTFEQFYTASEQVSIAQEELYTTKEDLLEVEEEVRQQNVELEIAYQEVRAVEQRYQSLYDFMSEGYLVTAPNGIIQEANRTAAKLLNVSQQFLVGKPLSIFFSEEKRQAIQAELSQLNQQERVQDWVVRLQPGFGEAFDAVLTVTAVCTQGGEPVAQRWLIRDIRERKQVEVALQESEARYRRIIETTLEGVWLIDAQSKTTFVNRQMAEMLGYTVDEMIGMPLFAFTDEEGRAIATNNVERRRQGIQERHDFKFYRKDGSEIWTSLSTNAIFDDLGQYAGALAMATDISDRKQAEQALRQQSEREELLAEITQRIRSSLNLEEILSTTVSEVRQFLQSERVFIYRFEPDWSGVVVVESVAAGWLPLQARKIKDSFFEEAAGRELYKQGRIQALNDIYTAGLSKCHIDFLAELQVRANLVVPILQGELWGLLVANHCSAPRTWQQLDINLLKQLAIQLAIALQQSQLYLEQQVHEQTLQQVHNKQALNRIRR